MAVNQNFQPLDAGITLFGEPGGSQVHLRFTGPFEGKIVMWDATFRVAQQNQPNIIDIGSEGAEGVQLTVTLAVPGFDLPTIRKTVIMIRQYRRLRHGRHEYGRA